MKIVLASESEFRKRAMDTLGLTNSALGRIQNEWWLAGCHAIQGYRFCSSQNRNIWVDREQTTLYLVVRLLVTFQGNVKGNPVRNRNCPAAVSRIEHPIPLVFSKTGKMGQ